MTNEKRIPHHDADGNIKHYCTPSFCPDIHGKADTVVVRIKASDPMPPATLNLLRRFRPVSRLR